MFGWLQSLTNDPGFMPHGHCFLWTPALLWLYLLADGLIAAAYFSIPIALWYYARRRPDLPYRWIVLLFGAFIIACGVTHIIKIWNIWNHAYWIEAVFALITGIISMVCAIVLWPIIPQALALPSHAQLRKAHDDLLRRHEQLTESENSYRLLIETAEEGVWMLDRHGVTTHSNDIMQKLLGCPGALLGHSVLEFVFEEDRAIAQENLQRRMLGVANKYQFSLRRVDGGRVHVLVSSAPALSRDGEVTGILALVTDVTELIGIRHELQQLNRQLEARVEERTRALELSNSELAREVVVREYTQQELRESNERLNRYLRELERHNEDNTRLNLLSDQLHCCDSHAELQKVLERSCSEVFGSEGGALLQWCDDELCLLGAPWGAGVGQNWQLVAAAQLALKRGRLFPAFIEEQGQASANVFQGNWQLLCAPLQSRGSSIGVLAQLRSTPFWTGDSIADDKLEQMLRAMADHTALALNNLSLREQLREQSLSDPLTGLYNRRFMYQQMDRLVSLWERNNQPFALILLDVDHFKSVNDRFGHDVGDEVLVCLADMLGHQVRRSDVACRMGGEEFVVLMGGAEQKQALERAEAIRLAIATMRVVGAGDSQITVSAGVALYPQHGDDAYMLLRAADRALYESKNQGRDRITLASRDVP
ncbi:MAG: Response regulator PleD [Verrucomicrobiaceae bacterium]|nr:Response regulator PleD [Verrucomicrobiaceae bacterium]